MIARARAVEGDVALFAHGHVLRVLAARWLGLPAGGGQHFLLDTGTLSVLGDYRGVPAVRIWNGPLVELSVAAPQLPVCVARPPGEEDAMSSGTGGTASAATDDSDEPGDQRSSSSSTAAARSSSPGPAMRSTSGI